MSVRLADVVIADFPYSDRAGSKIRPALVISTDRNNAVLADAILAAISRSSRPAAFTHVFIDPVTADGRPSGLLHPSYVQCENLFTLDQQLVVCVIGKPSAHFDAPSRSLSKAAQGLP